MQILTINFITMENFPQATNVDKVLEGTYKAMANLSSIYYNKTVFNIPEIDTYRA